MANDEQPAPAPPPANPQTPVDYSAAWLDWWFGFSRSPARQAELARLAAAKTADTLSYMTRALAGQAQEPPSSDPRFADPAWRQFPFNAYVRAFENGAEFLRQAMTHHDGDNPQAADLLPFAAREDGRSTSDRTTAMTTLPAPLVATDWLATQLGAPDLRILDCSVTLAPVEGGVRAESGRGAWEAGHIPGSGFADLIVELSARDTKLPFMMPPAEQFAAAMGRLGVGPGTRVVLYDSGAHMWATRLWWMLRAMGFDNAAVLDGGLTKWRNEGRALTTEVPRHAAATFVAAPRAGLFVDKDAVRDCLGTDQVCLLNALSADEHTGRKPRLPRSGRIPGSGNVPAGSLVDPATHAYLPIELLRDQCRASAALDARRVVTYCGGGVSATSVAFTLLRLGVADVAVYDGSLAEWSADASLPMETGVTSPASR